MPQAGFIDLEKVKALYSIDDIELVDKNLVEQANEYRLFFEIAFAIGLTILGSVLGKWDWSLFVVSIAFFLFGGFFLWKYFEKNSKITEKSVKVENNVASP